VKDSRSGAGNNESMRSVQSLWGYGRPWGSCEPNSVGRINEVTLHQAPYISTEMGDRSWIYRLGMLSSTEDNSASTVSSIGNSTT